MSSPARSIRRRWWSIPAPSAFSLAASRLGWPLAEITTLSLHGRPLDLIRPHLFDGVRLLVLTADETAPHDIAALLSKAGFGSSRLTVLEALGGPSEAIRTTTASGFDLEGIHPLNVLAIEVAALPGARILPRSAGLSDALFETDGQITKREIRAMTLSALAPRPGELLWDIGAGSGSISIEWMLADRRMRAIAIEPRADRCDNILRQCRRLRRAGTGTGAGERARGPGWAGTARRDLHRRWRLPAGRPRRRPCGASLER